jgi:aspartyl-tRNA(Asn)/glutamyl-tRNA(Gln) amidotransferase subunit A
MPITDDLFFAAATEINAGLVKREFSAVELVKAFGARLERLGPRFNALALSLTIEASHRAKDVDGDLKRERYRGPLQGVPYGAKDLLSLAGKPVTWGARPFAGQVLNETATVLEKLDQTGSLLIGKLSMVELAGGGGYRTASASLFGPGLNPWDTSRWSGGSSSGPASAVAGGLVPFALGSETSGSIISPSAYCGITGLRPTYGLVSRHGAMALSWTMDKIGPLCHSADDCGHVLQAIAGGDGKDPGSAGKSFYYTPQYARALGDLTIGFSPDDLQWVSASARPAFEAALSVLRASGVRMVEVALPALPYGSLADIVIGAEGASAFEPLITSGGIAGLADASQAASLRANLEIPAKDYLRAMRIRSLLRQQFRELFSRVDVLVAPSRYDVAPKITDDLDGPDPPPGGQPKSAGMRDLIPAGNLAGIPALSLPCGFANGLPLGLQLVGPAFGENMILALGCEFQRRTDWHKRRPPLVS